jgi:hypothetical protein
LGAVPCVLKAQMRRCIAVRSLLSLVVWPPVTTGQRQTPSVVPAESTAAIAGMSTVRDAPMSVQSRSLYRHPHRAEGSRAMHVNRGFAFWGVALITAGVVALAIQGEVLPAESAQEAWRLWPVALVVIGLAVIASRTPFALVATILAGVVAGGLAGTLVAGVPAGFSLGCDAEGSETRSESGTFDGSADVHLDFNCGDLAVTTVDGSDWTVEASFGPDREPQISAEAGSLEVEAEGAVGFPFGREARQTWDVELPTGVPLDLDVEANAASSRLDLADADLTSLGVDTNAGDARISLEGASVTSLEVDGNAGSVSISVDAATTLAGAIGVNAGSLELCAPDDAALSITVEDGNVTFGHNLEESGLDRTGDTWSSDGGEADVTLRIEGNAGSFTLNPDDGCA